jgi:hypothetical protein
MSISKNFGCIGTQSVGATVSSFIHLLFIINHRRKEMKKSKLTLIAIALTAIAITSCASGLCRKQPGGWPITSCASNPSAETAAAQNPKQSLATALEAAATPAEKAKILAKAAADAALEAAKAKAEAEAKIAIAEKAPGILAKKAKEEANKAQVAAAAAEARAQSLAKEAAAMAAMAAAGNIVDAVTEFVSEPESAE